MTAGRPVVWHNPACSKSRAVLAMLLEAGTAPEVIDYLSAGWTEAQLRALFAAAGLTAAKALRLRGTPAEALGLTAPGTSEAAILAAMVQHPELVERPFVQTAAGTALCRPPETVLALLAASPARADLTGEPR